MERNPAYQCFRQSDSFANRLFCKNCRNTQIILQQESGICDVVDPMGGSYLVESLTQQMIEEAMKYIDEVEKEGGMTKAEAGIPKMRMKKHLP